MPVSRYAASQRLIDDPQTMLDVLNAPVTENNDVLDASHEEYEKWSKEHMTNETWEEVLNAILAATRDAFPSSPPLPAQSPSSIADEGNVELARFNHYWRDAFSVLLEKVNADPYIPEFVTDPPRDNLSVYLFANIPHEYVSCPCVIPEMQLVRPSIYISNHEGGVKKGDLVAAVGRYLYGTESQGVEIYKIADQTEESRCNWKVSTTAMRGVLVYGKNWMCHSTFEGEVQALSGQPKVYLYCAGVEEFAGESESDMKRPYRWDRKDNSEREEETFRDGGGEAYVRSRGGVDEMEIERGVSEEGGDRMEQLS